MKLSHARGVDIAGLRNFRGSLLQVVKSVSCFNIGKLQLLSNLTEQVPPLKITLALELAGLCLIAEAGFRDHS